MTNKCKIRIYETNWYKMETRSIQIKKNTINIAIYMGKVNGARTNYVIYDKSIRFKMHTINFNILWAYRYILYFS